MADVSGIGDVIAGGIGGIANIGFGIYDRQQQREQERAARKRVKQVTKQTESDYNQMVNMLDKWRKDQINTATPEMVSEYSRLLSGFDPSEYTADIEKFKFTDESGKPLTREDFLATNRDQILQSVTDRIQHSAAGAGLGRGTAPPWALPKV